MHSEVGLLEGQDLRALIAQWINQSTNGCVICWHSSGGGASWKGVVLGRGPGLPLCVLSCTPASWSGGLELAPPSSQPARD